MKSSKKNRTLDGESGCGGSPRPQDVDWLSSLPDSELDFLISLKEMAIRRAKNVGYKDLGHKFDGRVLRALGLILLEYFKERVQSASMFQNSAETLTLLSNLSGCGMATLNQKGNLGSTACTEDIKTSSFVTPKRKRMWEGLSEVQASRCKKHKTSEGDL